MNLDWTLVLFSAVVMSLLLSLAKIWSIWELKRLSGARDASQYDTAYFKVTADRMVYGRRVIEIEDIGEEFHDSIEICESSRGAYTRILIDFPTRLRGGIRLMTESSEGVIKKLIHLSETTIGHEAFDSQFLILAPNQERANELINDELRNQMIDLRALVDEMRISNEGFYVRANRVLDPEELRRVFVMSQSVVRDYYGRVFDIESAEKDAFLMAVDRPSEPSFGSTGVFQAHEKSPHANT